MDTSRPYVIVLDEFSLERMDPSKSNGFFLLNILRACGFGVVLMGTNASAVG